MAIYLDSSAIVKLIDEEPESAALRRWLRRRSERASSALARVEILRAAAIRGPEVVASARRVLDTFRILVVDDAVLDAAAVLKPRTLRSLDAIHVASAQALGAQLDTVVTYDRRMAEAAALLGMSVEAPGT